jgi:hypothetical protein
MKKVVFLCLALFLVLGVVVPADAASMAERLRGKILLQVEENGEAWYVNPGDNYRYFLGRPADAFQIMRELGLGISEEGYNSFNGRADSHLAGKILLRVEAHGEAYYVNPADLKMHYLGRPADAFAVMRQLGLGITNGNLNQIGIHANSKRPEHAGGGNKQTIAGMIDAVDSCVAYELSKQSVSESGDATITMTLDNAIIEDNNDGRCKYRYKISDVEISLTDTQRQVLVDAGQTDEEIEQSLTDMQAFYTAIFNNGEAIYVKIVKADLKSILERWESENAWGMDVDTNTEIYNMWLDGSSMPGGSSTVNNFSLGIVSVEGVDGTAVLEINGNQYTMEKDESVTVDGHEVMYLGTKPTTCTINGEDFEGADCQSQYDNVVKYKYREL